MTQKPFVHDTDRSCTIFLLRYGYDILTLFDGVLSEDTSGVYVPWYGLGCHRQQEGKSENREETENGGGK